MSCGTLKTTLHWDEFGKLAKNDDFLKTILGIATRSGPSYCVPITEVSIWFELTQYFACRKYY